MSQIWIFESGAERLTDETTPIFTVNDRIRLGDGVFDTMLAVNGNAVNGLEHMQRLLRHAEIIGLQSPLSAEMLHEKANDLIKENKYTKEYCTVNTIISAGKSQHGLERTGNKSKIIIKTTLPSRKNDALLKIITAKTVRRNELSPLSRIKSFNYLDNIIALQEAHEKGADDALLLNTSGLITCTTAGNIFAVINGKLTTPPLKDGVMDGVLREKIIRKMGALEKSMSLNDLIKAEALYITNSIRGAREVATLDDINFPGASLKISNIFHLK